jgi:hypothetical protein
MVHTDPRSSRGFPDSEHLRLCHTHVQATSRSLRHNQNENIRNFGQGAARYSKRRIRGCNMAVMRATVHVTLATVTARIRQSRTLNAVQDLD